MTIPGFHQHTCWKCRSVYYVPDALQIAARANTNISFWCPYGHEAVFADGETEEQKMRRERDRAIQEQARLAQEANEQRQRAEKAERSAKRLKRRVAAGVCPCCRRTVSQMQQHMATKHPDYVKSNVVHLKTA